MLKNRKVTKDRRVVADFRHLNVRIAKNNLAYSLLKDTFLVLGSSRCKVLSVLHLKDAFYSQDYQRIQNDIVEFHHTFVALHIYIKECQWD